jgi:hypothetical protein
MCDGVTRRTALASLAVGTPLLAVPVTNLAPVVAAAAAASATGPLPAGVTLQAIDGETMTSPTTMSNNYYGRNGYSYAANGAATAGTGKWWSGLSWDDPRFFPIMLDFAVYSGDFSAFKGLNIPVIFNFTNDTGTVTLMPRTARDGYWVILGHNSVTAGLTITAVASNVDESDNIGPAIAGTPAAPQVSRFWAENLDHNTLAGSIGAIPPGWSGGAVGQYMRHTWPDPNGVQRGMAIYSIDLYWFGGGPSSYSGASNSPQQYIAGMTTADAFNRGSNYGNLIDMHRSYANGTNTGNVNGMAGTGGASSPIPLGVIIENQDGGTSTGRFITPPEYNWAFWSSVIHGARFLDIFAYSATGHAPANCGFSKTVQSGQSISIYQQGVNTSNQVADLARIINSPFALGYCTVSPHGYLFPKPENNWLNGGIELCVHWYQAGAFTGSHFYNGFNFTNGFYIFATTRNSETVTNTSATFTINDPNASSVNVIGESRSIPIVGGQFTDAFANAWTVHLYQVAREVFPRR